MKQGNWKSRKAYKKDLNGCHRGTAPRGQSNMNVEVPPERSLGAIAMSIAIAMMRNWRGNKRGREL